MTTRLNDADDGNGSTTVAFTKAVAQSLSHAKILPEFLRYPRPRERCPVSGLSRTVLYGLVTGGKVRTVTLRQKGRKRGLVLIDCRSLIEHLRSLQAEQEIEKGAQV